MAQPPLAGEPIWPQGTPPYAPSGEVPGGFGSSGVYGGFGRKAPPPGVPATLWRQAERAPRPLMWSLIIFSVLILIVASGALFALANGNGSGNQNNGRGGHGGPFAGTSTVGGNTPSAGLTPTPTNTSSPTPTLTPSPSPTPTLTPTVNPTPTVTPTPSPPCLLILPLTLTFSATIGSGNDPPSQNLSLQNCSNQISSWSGGASTTDGAPWLNFSGSPDTQNVSFTMNPGDTLRYGIDALAIENNLSPGSYSGMLTFTSSDGSKTVTITVSLTVTS